MRPSFVWFTVFRLLVVYKVVYSFHLCVYVNVQCTQNAIYCL